MSVRVLIVDDEEPIARSMGDIVESMDHEYDLAGDVETARKKLEAGKYDLLILDMNLPMSPGRLTGRRENGRNFIEIIRGKMGLKDLPIIVVTGHDKGEADFILSVIALGGMDQTQYIQKPIDGDKMDQAIRRALAKSAPADPRPAPTAPASEKHAILKPFNAATRQMRIYLDEVKLCGLTIWTDRGSADMREAILLLNEKPDGRYVRIKGPALMKKLGRDPSNPISSPLKGLCDRASQLMAEHCGLSCDRYDLIDSRGGYHLTDWVDVVVVDCNALDEELGQPAQPATGKERPAAVQTAPNPLAKLEVALKGLASKQVERLIRICQALKESGARSFEDIQRLSRVSRAQNMRDIAALTDRGLLEKDGRQKARVYRLSERASSL